MNEAVEIEKILQEIINPHVIKHIRAAWVVTYAKEIVSHVRDCCGLDEDLIVNFDVALANYEAMAKKIP